MLVKDLRRSTTLIPLLLVVATLMLLVFSSYYSNHLPYGYDSTSNITSVEDKYPHRVLIVDGIRGAILGSNFTSEAKKLLEEFGYVVDVVRGDDVTVSFLLGMGHYDIFVLRLHSAVYEDEVLYVFSGEPYTESRYISEQLTGMVVKAYVLTGDEPPYFALNAMFLGVRNPDGLRNSIVILMGCGGARDKLFIQSLLERGVKAYIAWDGYVSIAHSDKATLELLKALVGDGLSPEEAIERVMRIVGPDPIYGARLHCFKN